MATLLQRAGVDFAILGPSELCTGDPARRAGNEYLFQMLATQNIDTLNRTGVQRIITQCPHCFNTLANEYPQYGGHYEVVHHSQLLTELVDDGRLDLSGASLPERVTYHLDPRLVELVKVRASQINRCARCLEMHTTNARALGEGQDRLDLVAAWPEAGSFTEQERAALNFADGYAVELALLINLYERFGADAIVAVDLGEGIHRNRPLRELTSPARSILSMAPERAPSRVARTAPGRLGSSVT